MLKTNQEVKVNFREYGELTIPKGVGITNKTAMGTDTNYNFVDDFSWVPLVDGTKQYGLIHDLTYIGLNIPKKFVTDVTN